MRYLLPVLFGGSLAFLGSSNHHLDRKAQALDRTAGGYDKRPRAELETTNGTSPAPRTPGNVLFARDECNNGKVDCSDYQCDHCGSCCGDGTCAENFGNCCSEDTHCSFGFSCCSSSAGCCYEDTSFCCESSPTGCCVKGTQCTPDGCVGDPAFLIESVTVTTTLTSFIYYTSTVFDTTVSTNFDVTTKFVTSTVTRENIDLATVTNYITSTKISRRLLAENHKKTEHSMERRNRPEPPTPTTTRGLGRFRGGLENIGVLPKRDVTSYIYDFVFVWDTQSSVNSTSTQFSTITSTLFKNAKSTTTVVSTVVVTSTQVATSVPNPSTTVSPTEPSTTRTTYDIVVETTFVVGITNSGHDEVATVTNFVDGGGASGLQVATGVSTTMPGSDSSSFGPNTTAPTGPSTSPSSSSRQGDLSIGAKAGIGAGAGAASLALLGALVFFALGKRRRATPTVSGDSSQEPMAPSTVADWTPPPPPPIRYSHLDGREVSYTERAASLARSMENMGRPTMTPNAQGYQQPSNFTSASRRASPSTPSEMMGYEGRLGEVQEIYGATENRGWYMGPNKGLHEIVDHQYHEMPSTPEPSRFLYPGQGRAR
ncbi:hypothetical protein F5B21DRAFT_524059 [Xylaria acuta]|nr:hypothetical protein F5B21DRAFT_524059 [Xylaria acuta]